MSNVKNNSAANVFTNVEDEIYTAEEANTASKPANNFKGNKPTMTEEEIRNLGSGKTSSKTDSANPFGKNNGKPTRTNSSRSKTNDEPAPYWLNIGRKYKAPNESGDLVSKFATGLGLGVPFDPEKVRFSSTNTTNKEINISNKVGNAMLQQLIAIAEQLEEGQTATIPITLSIRKPKTKEQDTDLTEDGIVLEEITPDFD